MIRKNIMLFRKIQDEINRVDFLNLIQGDNKDEYDDIVGMIFLELVNQQTTKEQLLKKMTGFIEKNYGVSVNIEDFDESIDEILKFKET